MKALRARVTYANVMATMAVFIALGGSSYAALVVTGKNVKNSSLTGRDVKNSSLTTSDVKNGSLLARDFKPGQLPSGPKGDQGPAGPGARWALVDENGNVIAQSGGITARRVGPLGNGTYMVDFGSSIAGKGMSVSPALTNSSGTGQASGNACGGGSGYSSCGPEFSNDRTAIVVTLSSTGAMSQRAFWIAVF